MAILNVKSLSDVLHFENPNDGKIVANHTTTVNGIPEGYNDHVLDMEGATIGYFAGRILGGISVPRATIEKKTPNNIRLEWMKKWHGRIMDYVGPLGQKYQADPETAFNNLPRLKQLEITLNAAIESDDEELAEILQLSIDREKAKTSE